VERLVQAKGRPDGKPLPLLAANLSQVEAVARLSPLARRLAAALWPGPLTLVVPARPGLHAAITGGGGTVGVRVTSSRVAAALARSAGGALVATSANLAGEPPAAAAGALDPALVSRLDLVLDGGPTPGGLPSTVVAVEGARLRLLRPGATSVDQVSRAAGVPVESTARP
jgi:L-threonylcarbamoyladenylate synthase